MGLPCHGQLVDQGQSLTEPFQAPRKGGHEAHTSAASQSRLLQTLLLGVCSLNHRTEPATLSSLSQTEPPGPSLFSWSWDLMSANPPHPQG